MAEIDKVMAGLDTRLRKFKREWGVEFLERVKARTPVITGRLQRGWGFEEKAKDISIYNVVDYASFVEYGTDRMEPRAMMRTTLLEKDDITKVALERTKK